MYLVGLTGGIGSGKSTVAARLGEHGVPVVDADQVAREIVEPGEAALDEITEHFGRDVITPEGALDRPALARLAFADEEQRAALDGIMHPRIHERIVERVTELLEGRASLAVIDHPLLLETDQAATFDAVVVVVAPEEVRVRRLVEHRGLGEQDVRARMRAQTDDDTRRRLADHVIENDGTVEDLRRATDALLARLREAAAQAATDDG